MPSTDSSVPPMAIGSDDWPGLGKLAEECGELLQVIGKLMAYPHGPHPDGDVPLVARLQDELADVVAAAEFVIVANQLNRGYHEERTANKIGRFRRWHAEAVQS